MGAQLRLLRRRIKSVKSTAKITRAQELIASSRIVKAQQRMQAAEPYEREITRAVSGVVSNTASVDHPLTTAKEQPRRAAVLIVTSDRGFAGGFNANILREAEALGGLLRGKGIEPVPYVVGRKGIAWHSFRGREMGGQWGGFSDNPSYGNAKEIAGALIAAFSDEDGIDEIHVVSTEFISMLTQEVAVKRILPLEVVETTEKPETPLPYFEFEPTAADVLDSLLPRYVESRIFATLLQSAASEHAARRRAMKSATDNANELIRVFTMQMNQARQAEITQEISEIVGGANALADAAAGKE
ncbi:F0F1 ATP synthase subunit gamma [Planomonospora sp. ID91781]|uniref:ATP synthase gamma chain n=3 Tax=Planomonospora TaxID=1998 RepID=A0A171BQ47_9ACTN|nr:MULTISPECIES: F0F1 ATP synthase subunit gamma [Planomonospora]MBG0821209.1 F0F1 ATP synthase subunit gamma [Planomonospora sp. ID91781]GAT65425.1 F0F1 ATP synthase subunit gamma [Planomonospora sphaerica]GGK73975.1 ATP synthase gamma chain [Planomonospora parontospora]GII09634.1 ATP synthase gamma chain [Planomonospora parontospora subsp. parontospora]